MDRIKEEELLDEIITILMAALSLSGVRDDKMQEALEAYQKAIDSIDDEAIYDYKSIKDIILSLKESNKELFN